MHSLLNIIEVITNNNPLTLFLAYVGLRVFKDKQRVKIMTNGFKIIGISIRTTNKDN
ncbi:hypothetical protein GCM10023231_22780 [Olivibacter ginsenosidimutans]|uniref:Uncharacterized protein n=1 Tax=Olivibacter ginsenosidimutans TaxID=1176537 RepID=A0ABP9BDE8_9SPHI